jgi:hypothetical protein
MGIIGYGCPLPLKPTAQGHHAYGQVKNMTFQLFYHSLPLVGRSSYAHPCQVIGDKTNQPHRIFTISGMPGVRRYQPECLRLWQKLLHDESAISILLPRPEVEREQQLDLITHLERTP